MKTVKIKKEESGWKREKVRYRIKRRERKKFLGEKVARELTFKSFSFHVLACHFACSVAGALPTEVLRKSRCNLTAFILTNEYKMLPKSNFSNLNCSS